MKQEAQTELRTAPHRDVDVGSGSQAFPLWAASGSVTRKVPMRLYLLPFAKLLHAGFALHSLTRLPLKTHSLVCFLIPASHSFIPRSYIKISPTKHCRLIPTHHNLIGNIIPNHPIIITTLPHQTNQQQQPWEASEEVSASLYPSS